MSEERAKLPPEVGKRLDKLEIDTISFEAGEDFPPAVIGYPPEQAAVTKIKHSLGTEKERPACLRAL